MKRLLLNAFAMVATVVATLAILTAPVFAASMSPFEAAFSGTAGFTGPTTGVYDGSGVSTKLGKATVHGEIQVIGAPACAGGFTATHSDVITAANGEKLYLTVFEDACPVAPDSFKFHCIGTYNIIGGTGRYAEASGMGTFDGVVDFGQGQFQASYLGLISK